MYTCEKMGKSTVTACERELYRYYQPAESLPDANQDESYNRTKRASADPCLTAFAQLGALRLNAKRGIIALSAGDTQYIIAESGQALSLQEDNDEQDQLWHGVGLISPNTDSMGPAMAKMFSDAQNSPAAVLIEDLTKDDRFKDKCVVVDGPKIRAMACVPLRTPLHNVVIGMYVVVDDQVRQKPTECEIKFLQDVAVTVMDYLEAGRVNRQQYRAERMVKAIGHKFQEATVKKRHRNPSMLEQLADLEFGVQESSDYFSHNGLHNLPGYSTQISVPQSPSSSSFSELRERTDGRPPIPTRDTLLSATDSSGQTTLVSRSWQQRNSSVTTFDDTMTDPTPEPEKSVSFDLPTAPTSDMHKEPQEGLLSADVKAVFGRAANLIRESIGVEGVIYYDASIGSFGGSAEKAVMDEKGPGAFHGDKAVTSSEDDLARKSADEADIPDNGHASPQATEPTENTMAEIARLSAQVLSKMKTDFISSISHELRSPLHGVLASVEFLQETQMTEVQVDMVNNIHASGKVLLDTINHVLDFSKVNRRSKEKKRLPKKKKKNNRRESVDNGEEEKADICVLSEEVIESIYAGQRISKKAFSPGHFRPPSIGWKESPVTVIVDIDWRPNWTFEIDAGAWRRILMNIFSNAMKYTSTGFVKVSLELEDDVSSRSRKPRSNLTLRIQDSGKGISQEFLNHQLYKPFTQEDSLAMGAGLGLSIVKAIVQDLGGRIEMTSEPGTGTEAVVRIPLTASLKPAKLDGPDFVSEVKEKVRGLAFSLQCFDRYPDITETPDGILSAESEAAMLLKASFQSTLVEWFGMTGVTPSAESSADVVVVMESGLGDKSVEDVLHHHHTHEPAKAGGGKSVAIILTNTYHKDILSSATVRRSTSLLPRFTIFDSTAQPPAPQRTLSDLASPLSGPPSSLPPTSEKHDFAIRMIPISTPNNTLSSVTETPLSPPKTPIPLPLPTDNENVDVASDAIPPVEAKEEVEERQGLRVLLVEDNEINLKLLIATMRKLKLEHATATNGLEAFNSYKEVHGKFDVVFMDISMPIMSGIESTRHIRRFEKEHGLEPVALIALTGAANPNTRQEAFSSGVDLFLTKPVPMKALRGMLEDLRREGRAAFAG
ncbi:putative sensor protein gacS [Hyaloscypha finlandica]|nr:putative sensor protein gacS [Hyaloscypha sp. PMI_1271]KAH8794066.1 putative sensor protein gacS [Hyaloscypha finlandica]